MLRMLTMLVVAAVLAVVGTAVALARDAKGPEHDVEIDDFAYRPARVVVRAGVLVVWKNSDRAPHDARSFAKRNGKRLFATRIGGRNAILTARAPARAGTYRYFCSVHPRMRGTLVVR